MAENKPIAGGVRVIVDGRKVYEGPDLQHAFTHVDKAIDAREFWSTLRVDLQELFALGFALGGLLR